MTQNLLKATEQEARSGRYPEAVDETTRGIGMVAVPTSRTTHMNYSS